MKTPFASRSMIQLSGVAINYILLGNFFEMVAVSSKKNPTYTLRETDNGDILGRFCQKESTKIISGIIYRRNSFNGICRFISRKYAEFCYKLSYRSNWIWRVDGKWQIQKYSIRQYNKLLQKRNSSDLVKNFRRSSEITVWIPAFSLLLNI